eukprot:1156235-Amphidinium_carterae.2
MELPHWNPVPTPLATACGRQQHSRLPAAVPRFKPRKSVTIAHSGRKLEIHLRTAAPIAHRVVYILGHRLASAWETRYLCRVQQASIYKAYTINITVVAGMPSFPRLLQWVAADAGQCDMQHAQEVRHRNCHTFYHWWASVENTGKVIDDIVQVKVFNRVRATVPDVSGHYWLAGHVLYCTPCA